MEAAKSLPTPSESFEMSLRIRHPSLNPAEISRELQLEAAHSFAAGQPREALADKTSSAVYGESYWLARLDFTAAHPAMFPSGFKLPETSGLADERRAFAARDLDSALTLCVQFLRRHAKFMQRIQAEHGDINLLVELSRSARGFTLKPPVCRVLHDLQITIEFEFSGD